MKVSLQHADMSYDEKFPVFENPPVPSLSHEKTTPHSILHQIGVQAQKIAHSKNITKSRCAWLTQKRF
jgi:hypothetical protein